MDQRAQQDVPRRPEEADREVPDAPAAGRKARRPTLPRDVVAWPRLADWDQMCRPLPLPSCHPTVSWPAASCGKGLGLPGPCTTRHARPATRTPGPDLRTARNASAPPTARGAPGSSRSSRFGVCTTTAAAVMTARAQRYTPPPPAPARAGRAGAVLAAAPRLPCSPRAPCPSASTTRRLHDLRAAGNRTTPHRTR